MDPVTVTSSNMTDATSPSHPDPPGRSPLLELPIELRSRIYSFVHTTPRITIQYGERSDYDEDFYLDEPHTIRISFEGSFLNSTRVKRIEFKSPSPGVPDYLFVVHEDYEWRYLLTCKDIHEEAEHILPGMFHLRILVSHFDVQRIPPAVRARYLPHIRILTIVGSYPVYDTIFDGSQLTSLKTVYLRTEGSSSGINQQFSSVFPPPSSLIARIQGSDDREYIEKGLRKLQVSKLNWWQAERSRWLHTVLDARPTTQLPVDHLTRRPHHVCRAGA